MKLVLASQSPRRSAILQCAGIPFTVRASEVDERNTACLEPAAFVEALARRKAFAVEPRAGEVVLGADTVVFLDDKILGKPQSKEDAAQMLRALSGRCHGVYTGVCLRTSKKDISFAEVTYVNFYPLAETEIQAYIETGEPMDKAGSYGIQERGGLFVHSIVGDYFNVMGLPVGRIARCLKDFFIEPT